MAPTTPQRMDVDKSRTPSGRPTAPAGLTTRRRVMQTEHEAELARPARRAHVAQGSSRPSNSGAPPPRSIENFGRFTPPDSPPVAPRANFHQPGFPFGVTEAAALHEPMYSPVLNEPREYDGFMITMEDVSRLSQLPDLPTLDGPYGPGYQSAGRYQSPVMPSFPVMLPSSHPAPAPARSTPVGGLPSAPVPLPPLGNSLGLSLHAPTPGQSNGRWSLEASTNRPVESRNTNPSSPDSPPPEYPFVRPPGLPARPPNNNPLSEADLAILHERVTERRTAGRSRSRQRPAAHNEHSGALPVGPVRREKKLSLRGQGKPSAVPISPARPHRSSTAHRASHE